MNDPATPISIVMMIPPGSLPGIMSFATAPMTSPIISVHSTCILSSFRAMFRRARSIPQLLSQDPFQDHQMQGGHSCPPRIDAEGLGCCWNHQFLPDLDLVGILQIIRFGDSGILVGIAVKMLADFRKIVARLHRVALVARMHLDVVLEVSEVWIDRFDRIPDTVLA